MRPFANFCLRPLNSVPWEFEPRTSSNLIQNGNSTEISAIKPLANIRELWPSTKTLLKALKRHSLLNPRNRTPFYLFGVFLWYF